jgi:hypothetical protein
VTHVEGNAMTRLKYIEATPSRSGEPDTDAGMRTFRFPGSVRDVLSRPDPNLMSHQDLVQSIDQTLDRMQDALNALADDLHDSYRMSDFRANSGPGNGPKSAA